MKRQENHTGSYPACTELFSIMLIAGLYRKDFNENFYEYRECYKGYEFKNLLQRTYQIAFL